MFDVRHCACPGHCQDGAAGAEGVGAALGVATAGTGIILAAPAGALGAPGPAHEKSEMNRPACLCRAWPKNGDPRQPLPRAYVATDEPEAAGVPEAVTPAGLGEAATAPGTPDAGPATVAGLLSAGPLPTGQGDPAISAIEFVRSSQLPVGDGGVRAAINSAMSEFPSLITCTRAFMRAFCPSIMACVIGEVLLRIAH